MIEGFSSFNAEGQAIRGRASSTVPSPGGQVAQSDSIGGQGSVSPVTTRAKPVPKPAMVVQTGASAPPMRTYGSKDSGVSDIKTLIFYGFADCLS